MSSYTLGRTLQMPYDQAGEAVGTALGEQGFGVLTEIDLAATLHAKIGATIVPQIILGACRPQLAHEAFRPIRRSPRFSRATSWSAPSTRPRPSSRPSTPAL